MACDAGISGSTFCHPERTRGILPAFPETHRQDPSLRSG
jgi:hypothetical protein